MKMRKAVILSTLIMLTGVLKLLSQSITSVSITGTSNVGSTLTGVYTAVEGPGNHFKFEWFTSPSNNLLSASVTLTTYTVQPSENGTDIYFKLSILDATDALVMSMSSSNININSFPVASVPSITGTTRVGEVLVAGYSYSDVNGDIEAGSIYHWYRTTTGIIGDTIQIAGATNIYYKLTNADYGYKVAFAVIPKASSGSNPGARKSSGLSGVVVNDPPVSGVPAISGTEQVGEVLTASYLYSDLEGDPEGVSKFQWYRSSTGLINDTLTITGATGISYKLTNSDFGKKVAFALIPYAQSGNLQGTRVSTNLTGLIINNPPVATVGAITGSLNVNGTLIGHYSYSDSEGDIESGSSYQWYSSPTIGGTYNTIQDDTLQTHIILMSEQGRFFKFSVKPGASSGSTSGILKTSVAIGPVNTKPYVNTLSIFGSLTLNSTLKARYKYHDVNSDVEGISRFQWYRESTTISGATDSSYVITSDDVDSRIKFEVTPVSSSGYPDTGDPVMSSLSDTVKDPSTSLPSAKDVCIDGDRSFGSVLKGKYEYIKNGNYDEKNSRYVWFLGNTIIKDGKKALPDRADTLKVRAAFIDKVIRLAIVPRNDRTPAQLGDTVFGQPLAIFTLSRESFSVADDPISLTASPSGGLFNGTGVSNGIFSPSTVNPNLSPVIVTYQLTITSPDHTCIQNVSTKLSVSASTMSFSSFKDIYCQNGGYDTIYVNKIPHGYSTTFIMTDPMGYYLRLNDSTLIIDPGRMRAGNKEDSLYVRADSLGKVFKISRPFVIDSIPQASILNLKKDTVLCNSIAPFELFGFPAGGAFEGPVVDRILTPSLALGDTIVKYTYSTKAGCISSVTVPISINPSALIAFTAADSCIESSTDTTRFINNTNSIDPVNKWLWEFSDAGGSTTSNLKTPGYLYKTGGLHKVTLTATTTKNCTTKKEETLDLGVKPKADFYWQRECYHPNDSLMLFDTTFSTSLIVSRSWNFFDGDSLHTVKNPKYPKKTTGYLPIQYIVKTNYSNCHDTMTKSIYIRPSVSLATNDYFENFEGGNGGWVKDYEVRNSWSFGKPDRATINTAASGNNTWFTRYSLANQKLESSSIISPCFDFTTIQRPMISFMLWKRFDRNRDGAALQYKVGDEEEWQYIGTLDDGIGWYNSTLIKGRPGGDQIGWTAGAGNLKDTAWVESKHKLDELMGKKDVKFRIAYGSDGTSQDNDGIAFDDIWIGKRTRGVLLEHFTNNYYLPSSAATATVSDLANRDTADIINIQYHTNFPGNDPYYDNNPGDLSARFLYYGLSRAPYTILDGGTGLKIKNYANVYDYLIASIDSNDLARRSLINPSFSITLNSTVTGGILSVSGQIKALGAISSENITLYLAVTEKKSTGPAGAQGETKYYNVFRKFIPDAGGISLNKSWAKDESYTLTEKTWVIEKIANSADIEVIAFIQNNITKEIYQAESILKPNIAVGIENLFANNGKGFSLYPNPAGSNLKIAFKNVPEKETDIMIYDFTGTLLRTYKSGSGQSEYTIDNLGLSDGIYLVRVSSGVLDWGHEKLIVSKK
jgi:hypothetical protein